MKNRESVSVPLVASPALGDGVGASNESKLKDTGESLWDGAKLLIVDDSSTSRALLSQLLRAWPVEIYEADSGLSFLRLIEQHQFELILLDYRLPDRDGIDILREARECGLSSTVVMVTGQAEMYTATRALSEGADGYVEKQHLKQGARAFRATLQAAHLNRKNLLAQQELRSLKHEIYGLVAHDLRSPAACASMALKMHQKQPSEEAVQTAIDALDRLFRRLETYHDLLRIDSTDLNMKLEENCLYQLVDEVVRNLAPLALAVDHHLDWVRPSGEAFIECDWDWLLRAVENLVENALKYSKPGAKIRISCAESGNEFQIRISDQAPIISGSLRERIFRRYARNPETSRTTRGMGLGLVIVKEVAQFHGGAVELLPHKAGDPGNVFVLSLPKISDDAP